jgi:hypothetical protein
MGFIVIVVVIIIRLLYVVKDSEIDILWDCWEGVIGNASLWYC